MCIRDSGTTNSDETITVTVTNVAPALTDDDTGTVSEVAANDATVVDLDNTGDDDGLTWSITAGNLNPDGDGNSVFAINAATGVITVNDADDLDYEVTQSYSLTVRVTDGTTNSDETITVGVTNIAPTLTDDDTGTVSETAANAATVVDLGNTGDDDSITLSLIHI